MASYFFYDLETSGVDPRSARIMQFAGQRTDMDLNPVGEPYNVLIKLTDEVLPEPDAIMITGITPQQTLVDGVSEREFTAQFLDEIVQKDTIFVGFNSIRFDDEFMRFLLYRNFADAYEWQWKDGCSRWDMLDVVRMTRALRPEGIVWPFTADGKPTNRLELLSELNKLDHSNAHDALSDVQATISVARMIRSKQPKLFDYLRDLRSKKAVAEFVKSNEFFVYTSGKYDAAYEKTTCVTSLGEHPDSSGALVYDLRHDPEQFIDMSAEELAKAWRYTKDTEAVRLPVKVLRYNRCPAIAPVGVLSADDAMKRLSIDLEQCAKRKKQLRPEFVERVYTALELLNAERAEQVVLVDDASRVDSQLYEKFMSDRDRSLFGEVRSSDPDRLSSFTKQFADNRLKNLLPLYKARNFPESLSDDERQGWESYRSQRLKQQLPRFINRLQALGDTTTDPEKIYLLQEVQLYAESIVPPSLVD